jgi:ketosteroid isomerase-like protein
MTVAAEDRWAAAELLARYAERMDAGDFAGVGELLADAVVTDADGNVVATGAAQVQALYEATTRRFDDGTPHSAHVITNVIVDAAPDDELEVRSRFTVLQGTERLGLQPVVVGRYVDHLRRIDGEWRFVRRRMVPERWGDVGDHLTFDPRG